MRGAPENLADWIVSPFDQVHAINDDRFKAVKDKGFHRYLLSLLRHFQFFRRGLTSDKVGEPIGGKKLLGNCFWGEGR